MQCDRNSSQPSRAGVYCAIRTRKWKFRVIGFSCFGGRRSLRGPRRRRGRKMAPGVVSGKGCWTEGICGERHTGLDTAQSGLLPPLLIISFRAALGVNRSALRIIGHRGRPGLSLPPPEAQVGHNTGNADRLADLHGHELIYCTERQSYYVWTGRQGRFDEFVEVESEPRRRYSKLSLKRSTSPTPIRARNSVSS